MRGDGNHRAYSSRIASRSLLGQVRRFCDMCESRLPSRLEQNLEAQPKEGQAEVGARWALEQVEGLLAGEAPGFHLYALNQSASTLAILEGIRERKPKSLRPRQFRPSL